MNKPFTTVVPSPNFTAGRCATGQARAIVLHEVDVGIEYLDHQMTTGAYDDDGNPATWGSHESFHYGIDGCRIRQYVADADTAHALGSMVTAGTLPGWAFAQSLPPATVMDCVTLHIAVSTGTIGIVNASCTVDNVYSAEMTSCLAQVLCYLAKANNIAIDTNTLWRHGKELKSMNMTGLIAQVNACVNAPATIDPELETLCDKIALMPNGGTPTATTKFVGADCKVYTAPTGGSGGPGLASGMGVISNPNTATPTLDITLTNTDGTTVAFKVDVSSLEEGSSICSDFNATATPSSTGTNVNQPDDYIGMDNTIYLSKPLGWIRVACAASPTGFIALPAYPIA